MSKKKNEYWSESITELGVRIRIFEHPLSANLMCEWTGPDPKRPGETKRIRKSLGTADRRLAKLKAREIVGERVEARLTGRDLSRITLGMLFREYFTLRALQLSPKWERAARTRRDMFEGAWGSDMPVEDISQTHVDHFCATRRANSLQIDRQGRKFAGVRDGALDGDFRWLSSAFNWARKHKQDGRRLIQENPLHDVKWPKESEKTKLRPVASHERYLRTLPHADKVDPQGRLRCILALARFTGRREGAVCALMASDVLRSPEAVGRAIAEAGMDERLAKHMPNGALRWAAESDKQGFLFITPLSASAREELDCYLGRTLILGDAPLFPSDRDSTVSIRKDVASHWLLKAEAAANLPKIRGGIWHPYRRLWASERKHLPDVDVAEAGGWSDTRALRLSYQQSDPATVLRVVEHTA